MKYKRIAIQNRGFVLAKVSRKLPKILEKQMYKIPVEYYTVVWLQSVIVVYNISQLKKFTEILELNFSKDFNENNLTLSEKQRKCIYE